MSARTLLDVLQERFPDSSKTTLRQMLQSDRVRVNGAPQRDAKHPLADGDTVEIASKSERLDPRVRILFEDADLIVIDKAEGLLTVPTDVVLYESAESFLNTYAGGTKDEPRIHHVHRLDRDTSGVLVFAKNTFTRDRLQEQFATHDIDRVYVAIVHGKLKEPSGTFRSHLAEGRDLRVKSVDPEAGKEAVTHYRTTASGKNYSILELTLETGRRNQIRVHLAEAGHPVVGDRMYGGRGREDEFGRLALHARNLGFVHPRSGRKVTFTSDVPKSFREWKL